MSLSYTDNYSCSIIRVSEQCRYCGSSLLDLFKGCNIRRVLMGDEQNVKHRNQEQKGEGESQTPLPIMTGFLSDNND